MLSGPVAGFSPWHPPRSARTDTSSAIVLFLFISVKLLEAVRNMVVWTASYSHCVLLPEGLMLQGLVDLDDRGLDFGFKACPYVT